MEAVSFGNDGIPYIKKASDESMGLGLFAGRSCDAGAELANLDRPFVGSLETQRLQDTCANCYVWTTGVSIGTRLYVPPETTVQNCAGCRMVRYCGKVCVDMYHTEDEFSHRIRHARGKRGDADISTNAKTCDLWQAGYLPKLYGHA